MEWMNIDVLLTVGPLFLYFYFITSLHFRRTPALFTGRTDAVLLALSLSGFVMTKFAPAIVPLRSLDLYGPYTWVLLFSLYIFLVFELSSIFPRKFVVYHVGTDDLLEFHRQYGTAAEEDPALSKSLLFNFPEQQTVFSLRYTPRSRCAVFTCLGSAPSPGNWRELRREFRAFFTARTEPRITSPGFVLGAVTSLLAAILLVSVL